MCGGDGHSAPSRRCPRRGGRAAKVPSPPPTPVQHEASGERSGHEAGDSNSYIAPASRESGPTAEDSSPDSSMDSSAAPPTKKARADPDTVTVSRTAYNELKTAAARVPELTQEIEELAATILGLQKDIDERVAAHNVTIAQMAENTETLRHFEAKYKATAEKMKGVAERYQENVNVANANITEWNQRQADFESTQRAQAERIEELESQVEKLTGANDIHLRQLEASQRDLAKEKARTRELNTALRRLKSGKR